jgi:hypothetical protein
MSSKSNLFFKAFAGKKAKMPPLDHFAGGGMSEETPDEVETAEPEAGDPDISPDEKLAAYELLEAINGGPGGDSKSRAERVAKSLKSFFLIVDSQPHEEGGAGAEPMPPNPGGGPFG